MPLRKLWNVLRGRESSATSATSQTEQATNAPEANEKPAPRVVAKSSRGLLGLGRGPHDGLCRAIRKTGASSILEVNVGDGTRAIAVLEVLAKANPQVAVRYAAVDQFELSGGDISLIQFHRELRRHGIRPQIFPCDIRAGLVRVACTIGAVDLVLIAENTAADPLTAHEWTNLLQRVTHRDTLVLRQDGESWKPVETVSVLPARRRLAA